MQLTRNFPLRSRAVSRIFTPILPRSFTMSAAVYSTASLKESHAQEYKSMTGKLNASLLRALEVMDFKYMTPVQSKVLTELPSFTSDCLVQAKTGTGKTVAFLLPTLHSLLDGPPLPTGQVGILVLSPTRELALQIAKECDQLTSRLSRRLECHTAFGGNANEPFPPSQLSVPVLITP